MITLKMEKECGCFKKSDYDAVQNFASKDEALLAASKMCEDMNENFCQKHNFQIEDNGDTLLIKVAFND